MVAHLKLYSGNDPDDIGTALVEPGQVAVRLGDLLPLVAHAHRRHYSWLQDFLDDEVSISSDLHDVLLAFRSVRPSA